MRICPVRVRVKDEAETVTQHRLQNEAYNAIGSLTNTSFRKKPACMLQPRFYSSIKTVLSEYADAPNKNE